MQPPGSSGTLAIKSRCSTDTTLQGADTQRLIPWEGLPTQRGQGCGFATCLRPGAGPGLQSRHLRAHGQELVRVPAHRGLCFASRGDHVPPNALGSGRCGLKPRSTDPECAKGN